MIIQDFFTTIFQIISIPLAIILVTFIINLIKSKIKTLQINTDNETLQHYLTLLDEAVDTAVNYVNQTYVLNLKDKNEFNEQAQKDALAQAYQRTIKTLTYETSDYLQTHIGEFSEYIVAKIEASVYNNKKKGQEN